VKKSKGKTWLASIEIDTEIHRGFCARCASRGLQRQEVLKALVELYSDGKLSDKLIEAKIGAVEVETQ
jgi:hypothetical protein